MKLQYLYGSVAALLASAGLAFGQAQSPPAESSTVSPLVGGKSPYWPIQQVSPTAPAADAGPAPAGAGATGTDCAPGRCLDQASLSPSYRFWGSAEYLVWWTREGHLPGIIGTAPVGFAGVGNLPPGAINPLIGGLGPRLDYEEHSGGRLTAGYWCDSEQNLGVDASYFQLERKSLGFAASSTGDPLFGPIYADPVQSRQVILVAASPGVITGRSEFSARDRLWGFEANIRTRTCTVFSDRFELFAGFRHLQFDEGLTSSITATLVPTLPGVAGSTFAFTDSFGTHNRFYGPQVGFATEYHHDRWVLNVVGKVAIGDMQQIINISGFSSLTQPGLPTDSRVGGVLALPTNIGHHTRDQFTVVPEFTLNLAYQVTTNARAFIGYNFLYVSNVVRPGDQIDGVDGRQIPLAGSFDPTVRAGRPLVEFNDVAFWAHGINLGVELRY